MKRIGIFGSGIVAKTLGKGFLEIGFEVMLGTRDAEKLSVWKTESGDSAHVGTFGEVAAFGEILVLAVSGRAAQSLLTSLNQADLKNKIIIDTTNPIAEAPPENGVIKFFTNLDESLMEILQRAVPSAHFVKAFNSVGSAFMVQPKFDSKPSMFICGNDDPSKKQVIELLENLGWEALDFGKVESARAIEPLCMLWCIPGMINGQWSHAFKLLKK
jgi:8-hydroxy-5-deazaflavin:NADPH oxidoreductase